MRTLPLCGALLAAFLCSNPVSAQEGDGGAGGPRPDPMARLDADGSGGVSLAEFAASRRHQEAVADGDAAGFAQAFAAADADGNGELTGPEVETLHRAMKAKHFARIDSDGDGEVTEAEMRAFHQSRRDQRGAAPGRGEPGAHSGAGQGQGQGQGHGRRPQEVPGRDDAGPQSDPGERFRAADSDGSGGLSLEEFQALSPPAWRGHRPAGRHCRGGPQAEG